MAHGTTIYFKHANELSWRDHLSQIEAILTDFGACRKAWDSSSWKKYRAKVSRSLEEMPSDVEVITRHERSISVACDSIGSLIEGSIQEIGSYWERQIQHSAAERPSSHSKPLSISLYYQPNSYSDELFKDMASRGAWKLNIDAALDPFWAQMEVENSLLYSYAEVWDYYELVKRIHRELGFDLAAGSFVENYYQFGESEGSRPGFDSLFRFDRNGPSRLILPYEERRPFNNERDENGDNELSVDPETGLYRCMVLSGPM